MPRNYKLKKLKVLTAQFLILVTHSAEVDLALLLVNFDPVVLAIKRNLVRTTPRDNVEGIAEFFRGRATLKPRPTLVLFTVLTVRVLSHVETARISRS